MRETHLLGARDLSAAGPNTRWGGGLAGLGGKDVGGPKLR